MKRILYFLGLKTGEILLLVFVPYFIGRLVCCFVDWKSGVFDVWMAGLVGLVFTGVFLIVLFMAWSIIGANWRKAGKLAKIKGKST